VSDPDLRVHPAARGFQDAAGAYERARPEYPGEALAWLCRRLGIGPGRRVLDLAAGTGKLTRPLAETGAEVVAVEPAAGMRARLRAALPGVEALDGTAEAIPLADGAVDAVTVGQAFHWFRPDEALAEIRRVLRPGGGLGLVWNTRDLDAPLQRRVTEVIEPLRGGAPWWLQFHARELLDRSPLFERVEELRVPHRQELDVEGFVERFLSVSFVAAAPPEERRRVEAELRSLVAAEPLPIVLPYATEVYAAFARAAAGESTPEP
jgi:SAM-dependent methyltransferase